MVPAYAGARLPLTTNLAARVRTMLHDPSLWSAYPEPVREWLELQQDRSELPGPDDLLVEIFPRDARWYMVAYAFEGPQRAPDAGHAPHPPHGTRRLRPPRLRRHPTTSSPPWSANEPQDIASLFAQDMMGEDLEDWMAESSMLRRTFRHVAVIAGLIERNHPGAEKNRRQVTVNSDLIYDVLRRHQPDHILLRATRADAAGHLTDLSRVSLMLERANRGITVRRLDRVSPLAVPVLLDIGRESVRTAADEDAMLLETEALVAEAMGGAPSPATPREAKSRDEWVPAVLRPNLRRRDAPQNGGHGAAAPKSSTNRSMPKRPSRP